MDMHLKDMTAMSSLLRTCFVRAQDSTVIGTMPLTSKRLAKKNKSDDAMVLIDKF